VKGVASLLAAGVDINKGDYDRRTPLHLAASEGHIDVVKFLVEEHNANVNVVDRFGNTPLQDAIRGGQDEIVKYLEGRGAIKDHDIAQLRLTPAFRTAIQQSLPLLCERGAWDYVEVWVPTDLSGSRISSQDWFASKNKATALSQLRKDIDSTAGPADGLTARAIKTQKPILLQQLTKNDLGSRYEDFAAAGLTCGLVLPVMRNGKILACYTFFAEKPSTLTEQGSLDEFHSFAIGVLSSGLFKSDDPMFGSLPGVPSGQMSSVYRKILDEGVFNAQVVYQEVDFYYKMGLQQYYWEVFTPSEIATHIHSYIAAKKLAQTTGKREELVFEVESPDGSSGFYLCNDDHRSVNQTEQKVMKLIEKLPADQAYSYMSFTSTGPLVPHGSKKLHIAAFDTPKFSVGEKNAMEKDIWKIATGAFLRKPPAMRERYQEMVNQAVGKLSPAFAVYPTYRDGTIPVMLAFKRGDGSSYLSKITELLKYNDLTCKRKFIETFSNGLVVYSLYLLPCPREKIDSLLNQISLTALVPRSQLTTLFLNGQFSAEAYSFSSAAIYFVYYFTNQKSEEFDVLSKKLSSDPVNLARLKTIQTRMKREVVSRKRIIDCIANNLPVIREIYAAFEARCNNREFDTKTLHARISKDATNELDSLILNSMLTFTEHILKTNFYASKKSALSFRLDPKFIAGQVPALPFGLFLVMGYEFHGFHVRFGDIARGGIRMIRSANDQVYSQNFETLFQENFNLAHTQNKKNKDIPENGSKGTILLNRANQNNPELAFQKYVAGLVDLLVPKEGGYDGYKKQELLFLGPDEGTADYMKWAALYAQRRGYKFWKAFTTGKPPAIGGVPHDLFGMTTQGVHAFVVSYLKKMGLKEEEVTKFQTGGPDGDLGSNEILISKDKTIAIVDGSGVLFDPKGINREELTRLAKERTMVNTFNRSKLGADGFFVGINDRDIKLPSGELVENGLVFRNTFHLHPLAKADLFVPCGGRPESVNLSNVHNLFEEGTQKPKFKAIIEGANLFVTQDARLLLEKAGVFLMKDSSANKGGVTSSSLEVLAALSMNDAEFSEHMMVKDMKNFPPFYQQYVQEIQDIIARNADLEFECLWREHQATGRPNALLSDEVSEKIVSLSANIAHSSLWQNVPLRSKVLGEAIPKGLQGLIGLDVLLQRVPEAYLQSIFGAYLASHFVYKNGVNAGEFAFFEFMQGYLKA
jgi:glutamate dehydrogenase